MPHHLVFVMKWREETSVRNALDFIIEFSFLGTDPPQGLCFNRFGKKICQDLTVRKTFTKVG